MTIRRQWLLVLVFSVILTVAVNSIVLGTLINGYFIDYSHENYNKNLNQLVEFSTNALSEMQYTKKQLEMQVETYVNDPINRIRLYDTNGNLLVDVGVKNYQMRGMMGSRMMNRMMGNASEEVDSVTIMNQDMVIGKLNITKYSSIGNSLETRKFTASLIGSSALSFAIVFVLILFIGFFISKRMSKELRQTAKQAIDIDLGNQNSIAKSKVKEIRIIQQSLEALQARLKLKQSSRKRLIDELVHQTRTPLTILRTHLEGIEDGILLVTPEVISTCEAQVDTITSMIANMSGMIDADKAIDTINITQVELNHLLKQIIGALKVQFEKKSIQLQLLSQQKILLQTDSYKLSQVIYNILTNAYKFTESDGKVSIAYSTTEDGCTITIQDTGMGISEEDQIKIFEAYYRGKHESHTVGEGIGLYVVKENLDAIHGQIDVQSKLAEGSIFTVYIPKEL